MEEGGTGNDDEEPQICTVFSSTPSSQSKTIFDTIAFSNPKKEGTPGTPATTIPSGEQSLPTPSSSSIQKSFEGAVSAPPVFSEEGEVTTTADLFRSDHHVTTGAVPFQGSVGSVSTSTPMSEPTYASIPPAASMFESLSMSYMSPDPAPVPAFSLPGESLLPPPIQVQAPVSLTITPMTMTDPLLAPAPPPSGISPAEVPTEGVSEAGLQLLSREIEGLSLNSANSGDSTENPEAEDLPLPTANSLFTDTPEVPFPVSLGGNGAPPSLQPFIPETIADVLPPQANLIDEFSKATFSAVDLAYDAWILSDSTRQVFLNLASAVNAGTYFPDKAHMTTPGIIYKEDLVDKVAVNMSRIFGEVEANKRQILTADSVTQDDNGIRELTKLGCYRSAINLTKRILTLYGQGPGKLGQFSKHTPHSLQLWMTRITLLVRIREFKIAESELEAFKDFQNPDMYYEYYQDLYGEGRKGSMVPFHFRLIAAEIPQYSSKDYNKTLNLLNQLLLTIQQILKNIEEGISEDGSSIPLNPERREISVQIWKNRLVRVYTSLANAFMLAKDFSNTLRCLTILRELDTNRKPQFTSAIGRLFLQYGDLATSQKYFKEAASMRSSGTEVERVENLIDASLYFIAQGVYTDAFGLLKEALAIQPDNFMITNNMAVCLLYMGKVKESLALMETTVRNNTPQLLQENVILNLSTIYELENSDGFKKNALLKLISEYKGDGINLASLKMPNLI